jgi:hypothetical protein
MCENCDYILDDDSENILYNPETTSTTVDNMDNYFQKNEDINYDCVCGDCQCDKKKTYAIDITNIPEDEIHDYVLKIIQEFKRK